MRSTTTHYAHYHPDSDAYSFASADDGDDGPQVFPSEMRDGVKMWAIGAGCWAWTPISNEEITLRRLKALYKEAMAKKRLTADDYRAAIERAAAAKSAELCSDVLALRDEDGGWTFIFLSTYPDPRGITAIFARTGDEVISTSERIERARVGRGRRGES